MSNKLLVTGSSGLIGSESVTYFEAHGWEVHGVDNNMRRDFFGPDGDTTWVYVTSYLNIWAVKITLDGNDQPQFTPSWQKSADAMSAVVANGVVYYADNLKLKAVDAVSGNPLWQSPTISGTFHWQSPIVVNGAVYYATSQRLVKFALPAGDPIFANGFDGS